MKPTLPLAITLLLMFVSCSQAPVEYVSQVDTLYIRDTVHTSDRLTGVLHGKVVLYNSHGLATDNSGITVTVEGTTYTTTTNSDGIWMIDNLPTGTYDVTYARDGYTPYKIFGYQFIGGLAIAISRCQVLLHPVQYIRRCWAFFLLYLIRKSP